MPKIIPIRDLKNTSRISELCHSSDQPVFITKNGYEDMVIMSMDTYEKFSSSSRYRPVLQQNLMVAEPPAVYSYGSESLYSVKDISDILRPVFKEFEVRKAVLFGSFAKGNACSSSDIDIMVDSGLKGLKFFGLLNSVAEALHFPVDLIDIQDIRPESEIEKEINATGVTIYE